MQLEVGQDAPNFHFFTDDSEMLMLKGWVGKKNIVLYFYPKDDTPGCSIEAQDFKDHFKEFQQADTIIIGVSKDSEKSHANFKNKYDLPFYLVSDPNMEIINQYGACGEKSMFGKTYIGINRTTFLIDKHGYIKSIWRNVKVKGHVAEVLSKVKELNESYPA